MNDLDEWDEIFIMEAIRVEEAAVSSRNPVKEAPLPDSLNPSRFSSSSYSSPRPPYPAAAGGAASTSTMPGRAAVTSFPSLDPGADASGSAFDIGGPVFSPPRELSQRCTEKPRGDGDCEILEAFPSWSIGPDNRAGFSGREGSVVRKDKEVERLKRELGRLSKQLSHLESECVELKRDRSKKDQQLRHAFSQIDAKDAEIHSLRMGEASKLDLDITRFHVEEVGQGRVNDSQQLDSAANKPCAKFGDVDPHISGCSDLNEEDNVADQSTEVTEAIHHNLITNGLTTSSKVDVENNIIYERAAWPKDNRIEGAQMDVHQNCNYVSSKELASLHISKKLFAIWGFQDNMKTGNSILSKLLASCWKDFSVLFRCMSTASKLNMDSEAVETLSNSALLDGASSVPHATKLSRLYSILVEMQSDMAELHDLIEGLLDMCTLENAILVHRCLCIINATLQYLFSSKAGSNSRNNVILGQSFDNMHEERGERDFVDGNHIMDNCITKPFNECGTSRFCLADIKAFDKDNSNRDQISLPVESLVSIFQTMQQITLRNKEEKIRIEATSIMILILMGCNSSKEREMFGEINVFKFLSQLLCKEGGPHVHKQAVHLLFLFLNSSKILERFCTEVKPSDEQKEVSDGHDAASQIVVSSLLKGLAECLVSHGNSTLELKLRTHIIKLLAYVVAYGKSGFEVLNSQGLSHGNFLELIIQVLASEMKSEIDKFAKSQALCKERTSLMREALILLNRLVSNPVYSRATLEVLTGKRSTASLTIEVANRIPHESRGCWKNGEIVELARLFRTRVFAFLGGKHSCFYSEIEDTRRPSKF